MYVKERRDHENIVKAAIFKMLEAIFSRFINVILYNDIIYIYNVKEYMSKKEPREHRQNCDFQIVGSEFFLIHKCRITSLYIMALYIIIISI